MWNLFTFLQFLYYLGFYFHQLLPYSVDQSIAWFLAALYLTIFSFEPADRYCKVSSQEDMVMIVGEVDVISYILLIANLFILSIGCDIILILAMNWL